MNLEKWVRLHYMLNIPLYVGEPHVTGSKVHIDLSRRAATDGTVLLKNDRKILPL